MKSFISTVCGLLFCVSSILGQGVGVNESGDPAHSSAMLDVSSITKGMLIPSMTQGQRNAISSPATGLIIFQTDATSGFYFYNGSAWVLVGNEALSIDDLMDGKTVQGSVYLGTNAGINDDGAIHYNVGLGLDALYDNVNGDHLVAIGYRALYNNTVDNNHAVGYRALYYNTTGSSNTASGFQALYNNSTGGFNTALGYNSLYYNSTGTHNTGLGYYALNRNTIGAHNVGVGYYANYNNQEGNDNTIIGYQAGRGSTAHSKSGNVFIGYRAGYYEYDDNTLYIENSTSSSPLIYGEFDNDLLRVNGTLHIGSAYHFPTGDGASGQVLTTDGSGTVAWSTVGSGGGATQLNDLIDAKTGGNSVFLGADAGAADDGTDNRNAAMGIGALNANTIGNYNTAAGYRAGYYLVDGDWNTTLGGFSNYRNVGGNENTIIGYFAGWSTWLHSKSGCVHIGYEAGYNDTTDNKLYIENSSSSTPLIWGDFENDTVRINGVLEVTGSLSGTMGIDGLSDGRTGGNSVYLGSGAGSDDDLTDNRNVAVGMDALNSSLDGHFNAALGYQSLYSNEGSWNVGCGYQTLYYSVSADYNTAIGFRSSYNNQTGDNNVTMGYNSNYYNQYGGNNTIIGFQAGRGANYHSKSGSVFLGYNAGYHETTDNKLYIENSSSSTPLIWGDFDADSVMINGDFGVTGSWAGIGINDLYDGRTTVKGVFLGNGAGQYDAGTYRNVAVGDSAFSHSALGRDCVAIGYRALYSNQKDYNTAIGSYALEHNINGNDNTAVGHNALKDNIDGMDNIAIGSWALKSNTEGDRNTAVGDAVMRMNSTGSYNIAIGYHAQYNNTTGNYNTALGNRSLLNNIAGFNNTAIGDSALIENNYGDNNTAVGHGAGPGSSYGNLGNTTCLGYNTTVSTSNDVCIGNTSVNWIGGQVTWSTYSDERMKEDISKDVIGLDFIMKLNPVTYHVNKDKIDNILGVEDNSDYPEKYDIEKIKQSGFLAQEVEQAAVESGYDFSGVSTPINEHTPYSLSYAQFVVPLVKAVQEQQEIIEELRQEIKELKKSAE